MRYNLVDLISNNNDLNLNLHKLSTYMQGCSEAIFVKAKPQRQGAIWIGLTMP